ncbi:MAG: carbamate kinase [Methanomassiliicoccales archaeon]|nr:carbamate kinase [Methanomassiliicoccales archaeon]NYT15938.1 carbamate kinase [Methanomassiliicoccales archaeon]
MKTAVVAIGGNAILRAGQQATFDNQMANLRETCVHLAKLIKGGYDMVITHGNGPQVGNILLQNELLRDDVPPMPIDVCVAESQALLGYMIQQAMKEELEKLGMDKVVTCILTRVLVDPDDSAFDNPTKPVGPYYSEEEAREIGEERGWRFIEDLRRGGFRRVLPSPRPMDIIERGAIKRLVFGGEGQSEVVVAAGGGGIPVIRKKEGLKGVEAVVDKDLAACVLASAIDEKLLLLLTDVDRVYLNFGKEDQCPLDLVTASEIEEYLAQGHFPPGSMGPKVEAAIEFLRGGGVKVIITMPELLEKALEGRAGTHIVQGR